MPILTAGYSLCKSAEILKNYKKAISNNIDINKVKFRLDTELKSMLRSLEELSLIINNDGYDNIKISHIINIEDEIKENLKKVETIKNVQEANEIINNLQIYFDHPVGRNISTRTIVDTIYALAFSRDAYDDCEELTYQDTVTILKSININRDYNVFSSRARSGQFFSHINSFNKNQFKMHSYGLEECESLIPTLKTTCERTIKGTMYGSRISNDVFDVMYLTPQISWLTDFNQLGGLIERSEKATLRNNIKYLRNNGLFIYVIPIFRLTNDISLLLSKQLDNVQVIRRHNSTLRQVIIIGTKKTTRDAKHEVYEKLLNLQYKDISYELENKYELPSGGMLTPEFFRGSVLDLDEIHHLIDNSGLIESFWDKHEIKKDIQSTRPLMPFNMGQIGLVLTSGCLDGVVEEYEGQYHAIKGMVTKIKHTATTTDNNVHEEVSVETTTNKVQINLVTPDGQFIELA